MAGGGEVPEPGGCEQDAADSEAEEPPARQPERLPGPRGHRLNILRGSCSCAYHFNKDYSFFGTPCIVRRRNT